MRVAAAPLKAHDTHPEVGFNDDVSRIVNAAALAAAAAAGAADQQRRQRRDAKVAGAVLIGSGGGSRCMRRVPSSARQPAV